MQSLEKRIEQMEAVGEVIKRDYTDMERAVRLSYLLENGGPVADRLRAMLSLAKDRAPE